MTRLTSEVTLWASEVTHRAFLLTAVTFLVTHWGADLDKVRRLDDLIKSDWAIFAAAGVTSGMLLQGVDQEMESLVIGPVAEVIGAAMVLCRSAR